MREFTLVCTAILVVVSGPTLVSPLYPLFQDRFGLSNGQVALVAAMYAVTLIPALFVAGPLSDRWGRPALLGPGLGLFVLGDLTFIFANSVHWLVAGRLVQGLAMGAFFGPTAALASDLVDKKRPDHAALGVGVASMVGFGIGPFVAGLLIHADVNPGASPFIVHMLLVALGAVLLLFALRAGSPPRTEGSAFTGADDDAGARRFAVIAGVGGWAGGGLLFVMFVVIVRPIAGTEWPLVGGAGLLALMVAGAVAQVTTHRWAPTRTLAVGALVETLGLLVLVLGLAAARVPIVLGAVVLTGLGLASVHRGGIGLVLRATPAARKGWALSLFLGWAYFASHFPVIGFGLAADWLGPLGALSGYTAIVGTLLSGCGCYAGSAIRASGP
jgi:predicted MFS family arabinose efflux permease